MTLFQQIATFASLGFSLASLAIHHFGHVQHKLLIDDLASRLQQLEGGGTAQ